MKPLFTLLSLPLLFSFTFNPMSQSLDLGQGQKSSQFLLENDSNEKMAIELTVKARQMDEQGKEVLKDTQELAIFPPQLIIPAKEKRTIRVNWSGPKELQVEKAFRVIAEQLPLKVDEKTQKKSGIQMLMKYMAAFYVTPKDAKSELSLELQDLKDSKLIFKVSNKGNKHQILANPTVTLRDEKDKHVLKTEALKGMAGENVLAQSQRFFSVPSELKKKPQGEVTIKIED